MNFKTIIKYFLIWQIAIIFVTLLSGRLFPLRTTFLGGEDQSTYDNPHPYDNNPLLYSRGNFDGIHYLGIARRGYGYGQQAFFPLYPNLIRFFTPIVNNATLAAIAISSVSFIAALYFLNRLILLDYSPGISKWTIISLLVFPSSFFFSFVYTEGLFFLLVILSFYLARTKHWWLACLAAGLASYTRIVGILLLPALFIELAQQLSPLSLSLKSKLSKFLPLLIIPLGILAYMQFLDKTTGDPLAFIHVQKLFGQGRSEKIILLYQVFWRYLKMILTVNRQDPLYLTILLEFLTGATFLMASVVSFAKHRFSYSLFGFLSYLVPTLTGSFTSQARYILICFPAFMIIGDWISRNLRDRKLYLIGGASLFLLYLSLFVRGYWVA